MKIKSSKSDVFIKQDEVMESPNALHWIVVTNIFEKHLQHLVELNKLRSKALPRSTLTNMSEDDLQLIISFDNLKCKHKIRFFEKSLFTNVSNVFEYDLKQSDVRIA